MILTPSPFVQAAHLAWVPGERRYVGDISDIGGYLGRVYDDACDVGLTLISRYDGRQIVFVVDHTERHGGETVWWDLVPVAPAGHPRNPRAPRIRLFND